jgi:hypothetical protein
MGAGGRFSAGGWCGQQRQGNLPLGNIPARGTMENFLKGKDVNHGTTENFPKGNNSISPG